MRNWFNMLLAALFLAGLSLSAQPAAPAVPAPDGTNAVAGGPSPSVRRAEQIRADCLQGRRMICGKILRVLPEGLVVDSGYTGLAHPPLNQSWLIPGKVSASRPASLVEGREPESVCVGVIFLSNLPKARGHAPKPKPYDYVVLLGYPCGGHTYTSVGEVKKTVRRFSADLARAVELNLATGQPSAAAPAASVK